MLPSFTSHRALRLGLALLALAVLAGASGPRALAKTPSCADQVIADWYDHGRVGKIYPLHCYKEAIAKLPSDVLDYSNAKEEIGRALAFAQQGKPDPGGKGPPRSYTAVVPTSTQTNAEAKAKTTKAKAKAKKHGSHETTTGLTSTGAAGATTGATDTSGPSSVPVPLLVLGGLAVLLLAGGSAGYLRRRLGGDGDGDGTPPGTA